MSRNTTLVAELNRLANGGTYPARGTYLDEAGAADKWAGTKVGETVGALNKLAGNSRNSYRALAGVCNQLAGTTGLTDVMALASMSFDGPGYGMEGYGLGGYGY